MRSEIGVGHARPQGGISIREEKRKKNETKKKKWEDIRRANLGSFSVLRIRIERSAGRV